MLIRQLLACTVIATSVAATSVRAQGSRLAMVDSAQALIDAAKDPQAIRVLRAALNPDLGAPDATWARGVQLLGQTLLQRDQPTEAGLWLRWALRQSPSLQVDSVLYIPELVGAFQDARTFVATARAEPRVSVRYVWAPATASEGSGQLRAVRGAGGPAGPVQLAVNSESLAEGQTKSLPPGSYRIMAQSTGQTAAELTTEVLPGVTTVVTVSFVVASVEMSPATERLVLSQVARVDRSQTAGAGCRVGLFAGGSGLLIARYSAIRGPGQLSVRPTSSSAASERIGGIAAYDTTADLAVLATNVPRIDSLRVATDVAAGAPLWAAQFPSCGDTPSLARVSVTSVSRDSITLAQDVAGADQLGVLFDASGSVAGLLTGPRSARTLGGAVSLLASARANLAAGALITVSGVTLPTASSNTPISVPGATNAPKRRSKLLPIAGGVLVGGIVAALAMPKGTDAKTGGIVISLPR